MNNTSYKVKLRCQGFGKSWLTLARTKETNNDFLNWLRGITDKDEVWKEVTVKQTQNPQTYAGRELVRIVRGAPAGT